MSARRRPPRAPRALLVVTALDLGCAVDFDRYLATPADGGAAADVPTPPRDAPGPTDVPAAPDLPAGGDASGPRDAPATVDAPAAPSCPRPYLAVTVENLRGGAGQLLRLPLAAGRSCAPVDAVFQQPLGVAQIDDGTLVVAAADGVALLDPDTGALVDRVDYGEAQSGVLGVARWSPAGARGYAVAFRWSGSASAQTRSLVAYNGSTRVGPLTLPANTLYFASHPTAANQFLAVRESAGVTVVDAVDAAGATTRWLMDVSSLAAAQTVFTPTRTFTALVSYALVTRTSNAVLTNATRPAPVPVTYRQGIDPACPSSACTRFARIAQVADDYAVVLCDDGGAGAAQVMRTRAQGAGCLVLDGATLGAGARISDLTLVAR